MKALRAIAAELAAAPLGAAVPELAAALEACLPQIRHGEAGDFDAALESLPDAAVKEVVLDEPAVRIGRADALDAAQHARLREALESLHPWRKGPFELFGVAIDSEWRSDLKWDRVAARVSPLAGRCVLDVGCGNGYYAWRMLGAGARFVLGVDPTLRYLAQFLAFKRYLPQAPIVLLPMRGEEIPRGLGCFDTVFSMGVLYHRRAPLDHLAELHAALRPGGELVLETLVLPGDGADVLHPEARYARMRNVWAIPSRAALLAWLGEAGFLDARVVDLCRTSTHEQRRTAWMRFESLADCLDPADPSRTVEGHPAPLRAIAVATRP